MFSHIWFLLLCESFWRKKSLWLLNARQRFHFLWLNPPHPPKKKSALLFSATATAAVAQVRKPLPGRKPVLAEDQTVALFQEKFGFHLTTIGFQIVIWACLKSGECVSVVKCSWTSLVPGLFRTDPGNFFQMFWGIQVHIKGMVMLLLPY